MASNAIGGFPPQQLSFSRKNRKWRKKCVDFGDNHSLLHYHLARKSVHSMRVNYDLVNGRIHMNDLKLILNPYDIDASFIPDSIQHYSIINSKLEILRGEESERPFEYGVVITNPNAVSEIEEEKRSLEEKDKVTALNTVTSIVSKIPKLVKDLAEAEKAVNKELEEQANARGSQELSIGDIWAEQGV